MHEATTRIVNEWAKCAQCEECITLRGAVLGSGTDCLHKSKGAKGTEFVGCHRFDQSALGMIMYKEFGKGLAKIFTPIVYSTCEIRPMQNNPTVQYYDAAFWGDVVLKTPQKCKSPKMKLNVHCPIPWSWGYVFPIEKKIKFACFCGVFVYHISSL